MSVDAKQLYRLGASTLRTLPTLLDLVRIGVREEALKTGMVLSSETDRVVDAVYQLYRHVPANGKWYPLPADVPASIVRGLSDVALSAQGLQVCIAPKTSAVVEPRAGTYTFLYAYKNFDPQALDALFAANLARWSSTNPPMIEIIDAE